MTGFDVKIEHLEGGVSAAEIWGELDQATVPQLQEELEPLIRAQSDGVLIDLSSCEFIDSSGLAALVAARERITEGKRAFGICCPDDQVSRLLKLTGLDRAMGLVASRDEALAAIRNGASPAV